MVCGGRLTFAHSHYDGCHDFSSIERSKHGYSVGTMCCVSRERLQRFGRLTLRVVLVCVPTKSSRSFITHHIKRTALPKQNSRITLTTTHVHHDNEQYLPFGLRPNTNRPRAPSQANPCSNKNPQSISSQYPSLSSSVLPSPSPSST
jgi:hypothetical protein